MDNSLGGLAACPYVTSNIDRATYTCNINM
jgi:hypothetical protein